MAITETVKDGLEGTLFYAPRSVNVLTAPANLTVTPSDTGGTVPASTTRWFKVSACDNYGESLGSAAKSAVTTATGTTHKYTLTWDTVADATSYRVYISATQNGSYHLAGVVTAPTVTYDCTKEAVDSNADAVLEWVTVAYCTGFNYEENDGARAVYDHYEIDHYKRGRETCSGSISHLYTNRLASVYQLLDKARTNSTPCGFKLEINDDGGATVTETIHLFQGRVSRVAYNQPDTGDITLSADFTYRSSHAA